MARQAITEQTSTDAGITPAQVVGHVDGHAFDNDTHTAVLIENTGAGAHTITVVTTKTVNGLAVADRTYVIPAGEQRIAGPFARDIYDETGRVVWVNFDATPAEVKCSYFKVGTPVSGS